MHIFIIVVFLALNGFYNSSGLPVKPNETLNFLPSALQHLGSACENFFLADIIKQKSDTCKASDDSKNLTQTDVECFMFYDINSQLCAAFQNSDFNLEENYNRTIKEKQNIVSLCDHAKTWKFDTIEKHPEYNVLQDALSDSGRCPRICGDTLLMSDDANYYCAYFKWGTEVIQNHGQKSMLKDNNVVISSSVSALNNVGNIAPVVTVMNTVNVSKHIEQPHKIEVKPIETNIPSKTDETGKEISGNPEKLEQKSVSVSTIETSDADKTSTTNTSQKITEQSIPPVLVTSIKEEDKRMPVQEEPPKKDEVENNGAPLDTSKELLNDSKLKHEDSNPEDDENDTDDYGQPDDLPLDKNKKPENGVVESDPNVVFKDQNHAKIGIESITYNNGNPPQRVPDIFPNAIQDSFTNDDDHFFPIFLTAIIIVVLLYIIYHNKTKFTKVILGLIVEGRQSGRRRNSRGHAYRRLDTLEQAMNANTAAPPSKIIY